VNNQIRVDAPRTTLLDAAIIILISVAVTILIFWFATTLLGGTVLARLPDFIRDPFKAIWSSVLTGGAGIGLAILRALQARSAARPDYLVWIGITVGAICLFVLIVSFVAPKPPAGPLGKRRCDCTAILSREDRSVVKGSTLGA
jgi:hypothetical protein